MNNSVKNYVVDTAKAVEFLADMMIEDLDRILSKKQEKKIKPIECHKGQYSRS